MSKDSRSFGRTGPAVVRSCGCNALPWEDCQHSAWDAQKSLQRVIEEADAYVPAEPGRAAVGADRRLREVLEWTRQINALSRQVEDALTQMGASGA